MTDTAYLERFTSVLHDATWRNWTSQIKAKAYVRDLELRSEPKWTYDSAKLVRTATLLQGLLVQLFEPSREQHDAIEVGRLWEAISRLEDYQNAGSVLLAAVSYEVSGSSANSGAVIAKYRAAQAEPNALFDCVELLLQRKLLSLRSQLTSLRPRDYESMGLVAAGILEAVEEFSEFLLSGDKARFISAQETIETVARATAADGAVVEHLLANAIKRLISVVKPRCIWNLLGEMETKAPALWRRYLQLLARGLGRDLLSGSSVTELWPSQRKAVAGGLLDGTTDAFAIRMPTSAGKTRVAEMAMVKALADDARAKVIYIAPYRALANELSIAFRRLFGDLGFAVTASIGSYEYEILEDELLSDADIAVLTPERLDLLSRLQASTLERVSLVVLDEGHILLDEERGIKTELLLTRLRAQLPKARFIVASAVIGESGLHDISRWLTANRPGVEGSSAVSEWRPALQQLATCESRGSNWFLQFVDPADSKRQQFLPAVIRRRKLKYLNEETQRINTRDTPTDKGDVSAELALRLSRMGPVLVYTAQPEWTNAIASRIQELAELDLELRPSWWGNIDDTPGRAEQIAHDWYADGQMSFWLSKGVAIHNGDLPDALKDAIEKDARDNRFRIIVATATLSTGVNIPIRSVIIHSYGRFVNKRSVAMPPADYWNIIGRAGRAGFETEGLAVHVVESDNDAKAFANYLKFPGVGAELQSGLLYLARLVEVGIIEPEEIGRLLDPEILPIIAADVKSDALEQAIDAVLSRTLASYQIGEPTELRALKSAMNAQARRILEAVPSPSARLTFSQTGLASEQCLHIYNSLLSQPDIRDRLMRGSFMDVAGAVLPIILTVPGTAPELGQGNVLKALLAWLSGNGIGKVLDMIAADGFDPMRAQKLIDREFRYRIPWHLSALLRIASLAYGDDIVNYTLESRLLPAMLRNGLPTVAACYAASLGIPTRTAAISLGAEFRAMGGDRDASYSTFRRWVMSIPLEVLTKALDLHGGLLEDVLDGLQASGRRDVVLDSLRNDDVLPRIARVQLARGAERLVTVGARFSCARSYSSLLERNSVEIVAGRRRVGRLNNDDQRIVAAELDSGTTVEAEVLDVSTRLRVMVVRLVPTDVSGADI